MGIMLTYVELKQNSREFLAMTSLSVAEFEDLLQVFEKEYALAHPPTLTAMGKPRHRKIGGGMKSRLASPADKLLFVLIYQKTYMLQTAQGLQFGYSQSRTNELIQELLPLLQKTLQSCGYAPLREGAAVAKETVGDYQIDGTDRRRLRPENPEKQREYYSGKRKAHSVKNLVLIKTNAETVVYLSPTVAGSQHDKKIADTVNIQYPPRSTLTKDTGFQAYEPAEVHTIQPTKKNGAARCTWLKFSLID